MRLSAICAVLILLASGCSGGGGGGQQPAEPDPPGAPQPAREYYAPGQYARVQRCTPFEGDASAPLKIFFIDINHVEYFDDIVADAVAQLGRVPPFSQYVTQMAFFRVDIDEDESRLACETGSTLECDHEVIDTALEVQCGIGDTNGLVKVGVVASSYGSTGGEIIYLGAPPGAGKLAVLARLHNTFVHELAHNFGLADLFPGQLHFDGSPSRKYSTDLSRAFFNADGPGCPKWCNDFKPASEYTRSPTAVCMTFESKQVCTTYHRNEQGDCTVTGADGNADCCVWSETEFEYFGSQCVPWWGTENTGLDCLAGSGCYFGAVQGNYAWRPIRGTGDSLMYSLDSPAFSSPGERALDQALTCCVTAADADPACESFRSRFADFLYDDNFKHRIGSCGVILQR